MDEMPRHGSVRRPQFQAARTAQPRLERLILVADHAAVKVELLSLVPVGEADHTIGFRRRRQSKCGIHRQSTLSGLRIKTPANKHSTFLADPPSVTSRNHSLAHAPSTYNDRTPIAVSS